MVIRWNKHSLLNHYHRCWKLAKLFVVFFFFWQARNKTTNILAAAKIIEITSDEELEDFMVEIEILQACSHEHIVGLYETYLFNSKLWVSWVKLLVWWILGILGRNSWKLYNIQLIRFNSSVEFCIGNLLARIWGN